MAGTIVSDLTNITNAGVPDAGSWDDLGGGPGSGQNQDLPIESSSTRARRIDNQIRGFGFDNATAIGMSVADHLGYWVNVLQPAQIGATQGLEFSISDSGADCQSGNWNGYQLSAGSYPRVGGWQRVWIDLNRARDTGAGTLTIANAFNIGCEFEMGDVGGTSQNCHLDKIDYSTSGLAVTAGTTASPATFQDLIDQDTSIVAGIIDENFIFGPVRIGPGFFQDQDFAFNAKRQPLARTGWQSLNFTSLSALDQKRISGGFLKEIDLSIVGVSGCVALGALNVLQAPTSTSLNETVFWGGAATNCADIIWGNATLQNNDFSNTQLLIKSGQPLSPKLDGMTFTAGSSTSNHGLVLLSGTSIDITLNNVNFNGFASAAETAVSNRAIYNNSRTSIVLRITGTSSPTVRNGTSASTSIILANTLTLTGLDVGTEVHIYPTASTALITNASISTGSGGEFSTAIDAVTFPLVDAAIIALSVINIRLTSIAIGTGDVTIPVDQQLDRQYENP